MAQVITIQPYSDIDTIQKALDAITDTTVTIYIKNGTYQFQGLVKMSKADTLITWIGEGINTTIKFLNSLGQENFKHETTFKKLRFKCDDTIPPYYSNICVMIYFGGNTKALFENCLFDVSDDGLKPTLTHGFIFLHNNGNNYISNKTFKNCTFNRKGLNYSVGIGDATFENCIYNTNNLIAANSSKTIITNCYQDDIDPVTYEPLTYKSYGIYAGTNALIPPSTASDTIKESVYSLIKEELKKYNITFYNEDNTNISTLSDTEDISTFKDEIVSTINSAIESNTGGD